MTQNKVDHCTDHYPNNTCHRKTIDKPLPEETQRVYHSNNSKPSGYQESDSVGYLPHTQGGYERRYPDTRDKQATDCPQTDSECQHSWYSYPYRSWPCVAENILGDHNILPQLGSHHCRPQS